MTAPAVPARDTRNELPGGETMTRNVWAMQDDFDSTTDPAEQERLRQEMRDNGYRGVADTIGKTDGQS